MSSIPRLSGFDQSLSLWREGYHFLPRRFERLDTDMFEARLGLEKTICLRGREGAELFYDTGRFRRRGAAPGPVKKTLLGRGGVQGLDGEAHRHRKALFMGLMTRGSVEGMVELVELHWRNAIGSWEEEDRVELLVASREVLCRAVCDWAGVPLTDAEISRRAEQLARLIDAPGAIGLRHWRGRVARQRTNAWIEGVIGEIRAGRLNPPEGSAARTVALFREQGELLPLRVAAVELLNLLRPTVAINRYITFAALAIHQHASLLDAAEPEWSWSEPRDVESFVHEVRRFYPFFPFVAARVKRAFEWRGHPFEEGRLVLLDLHGTNRDGNLWEEPQSFLPRRFRDREIGPFTLVPQGGGDHHGNHRCAGEWITIAVMGAALRLLTGEMTYRVPDQDLSIDCSRMPARPASGFVLSDVRACGG